MQNSTTRLRLRRIGIAIVGFGVLVLGLALLVVPVPGTSVLVFSLGLTILAREFRWARRLLGWSIAALRRTWATVRRVFGGRPAILAPLSLSFPDR